MFGRRKSTVPEPVQGTRGARARGLRIAAICLLSCLIGATTRGSPPAGLALEEVARGVYVHHGAAAGIDDPGRGDSANIGFIVGARCVAVIDTGGAVATGAALLAALRGVTDKPVCYVVNTHVHFDHVLGNAAFRAEHPAVVGHVRLSEALEANREFFAGNFAAELGAAGAAAVVPPTEYVEATRRVDLGERVLTLAAHPSAHTTQDLTVFDESTGTLWTGDLVFLGRIPALDSSLRGWLAVLSGFDGKSIARVVPGHGPTTQGWAQAAAPTRRYLTAVLDETRAAIAAGTSVESAVDTVASGERESWALFDAVHGRNVTRAYKELEWE